VKPELWGGQSWPQAAFQAAFSVSHELKKIEKAA
jgi:hypothetical protein